MEFSGNEIQENKIYIVMNKPKGYVCSAVSDSHKTVYEILPEKLQFLVQNAKRGERLHTVGRLDCETSGLLIITTDGQLSNYLTRAENKIKKTYEAKLSKSISIQEKQIYSDKALEGVMLPAEKKAPEEMSLPSKIQWVENDEESIALITVVEGKFHEVRRIFQALGNEVLELKRTAIQNLKLSELDLKDGQFKYLTKEEIARIIL